MKLILTLSLIFFPLKLQAQEFQALPCLLPNIEFWKKILLEYSEYDLVFHNDENFDIYKVVKVDTLDRAARKKIISKVIKELENELNSEDLDALRVQQGINNRFQEGMKRSKHHLSYISKVFQERNIPQQIKYLPHVESGFNPKAGSKVGARGMWQIMPGTAKMYGVRNTKKLWDPKFSTHLAATILKDNHDTLGSWDLAINAYNAGPGHLKRAIEQTGSRDVCKILSEYRRGSFKFASRNYLGQFYAVLDIMKSFKEEDQDVQEYKEVKELKKSKGIKNKKPKIKKHKNKKLHKNKHKKD